MLALVCLAALSSDVCQGGDALVGKEFCAEGACPISSTSSDTAATSTDNPELLQAGPASADRDTQDTRTRRVGFSHEDVLGEESLRPFLSSFRESLAKGAEDAVDSKHVHSRRSPVADAMIRVGDESEVTKSMASLVARMQYGAESLTHRRQPQYEEDSYHHIQTMRRLVGG